VVLGKREKDCGCGGATKDNHDFLRIRPKKEKKGGHKKRD
jgi:hypothetical protein